MSKRRPTKKIEMGDLKHQNVPATRKICEKINPLMIQILHRKFQLTRIICDKQFRTTMIFRRMNQSAMYEHRHNTNHLYNKRCLFEETEYIVQVNKRSYEAPVFVGFTFKMMHPVNIVYERSTRPALICEVFSDPE